MISKTTLLLLFCTVAATAANGMGSKSTKKPKSSNLESIPTTDESIYSPDFLAQELAPPGKKTFSLNDQEIEMKFDLRFFTFNGEVQNYGSRIYQGQTTNMKTTHGGITPIRFV